MEDKEIVDLYWQRNEAGIAHTQMKYGLLCRQVAGHILPDQRDVEECVSDALTRLWTAIPPERPQSLKAYLLRVVRNVALDRAVYNSAQMRKSSLTESFEELQGYLSDSHSVVHRHMEQQELREFLNRFLQGLKKEQRIIFVRRYWYGESVREICDGLKISESKVKSSLFHTRNRLRQQLQQEGVWL